jgi:hypothetical protein
MDQHEASRTLVKSPPELWMACSDEESLSRHLKAFGEIRITRREPEKTVAWEGDAVCGTVEIEPSGWGTRVTLRARSTAPEAPVMEVPVVEQPVVEEPVEEEPAVEEPVMEEPEPEPEPEQQPLAEQEHEVARRGLWKRLFGRRRLEPSSVAPEQVSTAPEPASADPEPASAAPEPVSAAPEPMAAAPESADPAPPSADPPVAEPPGLDTAAVLDAALDSLGQAHHRPFSRA